MKDFVIITDSTCDLPYGLACELGLEVVNLKFNINGKEYLNYLDNRQLDPTNFYDLVKEGHKPTTSQVNSTEFKVFFEKYIKEGKDIIYIGFSSALSGTFNSSRLAKDELLEIYPDSKIELIDSKSASLGEGLLCYYVAKKKLEGATFEQTVKYTKETMLNVCHWFTVNDINHLQRGGRVSKVGAIVAKTLNIKPVMHVDNEGRLIPRSKVVGRKKALKQLVEKMKESAFDGEQTVFIGHGDDQEAVDFLITEIKKEFKVSKLIVNMIGPVIGSHTGQGVIALFFLGKER